MSTFQTTGARATGLATLAADGTVLDTWYPAPELASDVAKRTFSGGSLYCASKYAQDAFSASLRKELRSHGIKVSVVYPGLVDTFFHDGNPGQPHRAEYLKPHDIADAVAYILNAPAHVVIDELMLHPLVQDY